MRSERFFSEDLGSSHLPKIFRGGRKVQVLALPRRNAIKRLAPSSFRTDTYLRIEEIHTHTNLNSMKRYVQEKFSSITSESPKLATVLRNHFKLIMRRSKYSKFKNANDLNIFSNNSSMSTKPLSKSSL